MAHLKLVGLLLAVLLFSGCVEERQEVIEKIEINVSNQTIIEIPANVNSLNYGTVPQGAITSKIIGFNGTGNINLSMKGDITEWVQIEPAVFDLNGHQNVTIQITVPINATQGKYTGYLIRR